ncbi:helix-turn-helix domain-containing protein [Agaribacterium haliotis]|uniref:helix-turn-helix domain-containing protein n=1 Tax=Agaribacterium haliotis TaxID=2013869 RepID=UPI00117895BA
MYAFYVRLGVSRATLQKMEKGDLSVSLEKYYRAAQLLGVQDTFDGLFDMEEDFFQ